MADIQFISNYLIYTKRSNRVLESDALLSKVKKILFKHLSFNLHAQIFKLI